MKRLLQHLTATRIALTCIVVLVALGGASYAALTRASGVSSKELGSDSTGQTRARGAGQATAAANERRLGQSRSVARQEAARAQARAKARAHAKVRKAVHKQRPRRRPISESTSRAPRKARSVRPVSTSQPTRAHRTRPTDQARAPRKPCRRRAPAKPGAKRSDHPAPVPMCKRRPTQPPPPPPPPPPPQVGDDR
jgi:hypothetical protein